MTLSYKHAVSVTGQVYFCAAPIRLDAYDGCQFGCIYCFSRRRSRVWAASGVHQANATAFAERMKRVMRGEYRSALDEFLAARVPLQLGGLHDPFTRRENDLRVTHSLLCILRDFEYPTLISTKGDGLLKPDYVSVLREMNVVVRFSAAGVAESARAQVDRGCCTFDGTLSKIKALSSAGIATGLRIQPVIPGFEAEALNMAQRSAAAGVNQVSFEYLKLATESLRSDSRLLLRATGVDVLGHMTAHGTARLGWDVTLVPDAKRAFVREARSVCHKAGIRFGAGDTEFIPWSDGDGCCGSSTTFLRNSRQFESNFVGAIKTGLKRQSHQVRYKDAAHKWGPSYPVSTYLNWQSRGMQNDGTRSDWEALIAHRWNGANGPYSPGFFDGVAWTGKTDVKGFRIYDASGLSRSLGV
jgi:DNA repair photolyase